MTGAGLPPTGSEPSAGGSSEDPEDRIEEIAERYLEELRAGNRPDRRALLAAHPDLASQLGKRLSLVEMMHQAASSADSSGRSAGGQLRCPHCGHRLRGREPWPPEVVCESCGSSFQVDAGGASRGAAAGMPRTIGRFEVIGLLGRGAHGSVYQALDEELDRFVAIKVPRAGIFGTLEEEERFLREARSAALLRHPGVVQVHEIAAEGGVPYIVSEYVEGRTLAEVIATARPSFREAAELTARIAEILDHAHRQKVIHRDIKPGNILIDSAGRPHLTDFGLARRKEEGVTVTLEGQILGTPAYMSPEQAAGDQARIEAQTDVYSLGVILYEILTGERPFRGSRNMLVHQVLHDEPRPPRSLNDHLPRDLETICLKAMAKEPSRRYPTAQALADDLRRFLHGEPIRARPVGELERFWRWCRRKPAVASLAGAVAALLLAAAVGSNLALFRIEEGLRKVSEERDRAALALREGQSRLIRLHVEAGVRRMDERDLLGSLNSFVEVLGLEPGGPERERAHRSRIAMVLEQCPRLLQIFFHDAEVLQAVFSPDESLVLTASGGEARVWEAESGRLAAVLEAPGRALWASFSPDGRRVLVAGSENAARVFEWATGAAVTPLLEHGERLDLAVFSPDGQRVLTAGLGGPARLWDAQSGEPLGAALDHQGGVNSAVFSADGRSILTVGPDSHLKLWDAAAGSLVRPPFPHEGRNVVHCAFSPDGRRGAAAIDQGYVVVWDLAQGKPVGKTRHLGVGNATTRQVTFSPDGRLVALAGSSGARVWEVDTGNPVTAYLGHKNATSTVEFSPDGRHLLSASTDGTARIWNTDSGAPAVQPLFHARGVNQAHYSRDGFRILTASADGTARIWSISRGEPRHPSLRHPNWVYQGAFSPDGSRIVSACREGFAQLWDAATGEPVLPPFRHEGVVLQASFSPDGRLVVTASGDGTAAVWDAATGNRLAFRAHEGGEVRRASFSPDSRLVVSFGFDHAARVWKAESGEEVHPPLRHRDEIWRAVFSHDGRRILTSSFDRTAVVWEAGTGKRLLTLEHEGKVHSSNFSPDDRRIVTAAHGMAQVWNAVTGERVAPPLRHHNAVTCCLFSPDGRRVLTTSYDGTARIWDTESGDPVTKPLEHERVVFAAYSPDGRRVATCGGNGQIRVWDAATGEPLAPLFPHRARADHVVFSRDGSRVLSFSHDTTGKVWELSTDDRPLEELRLLAELLSGRKLHPLGGSLPLEIGELRGRWESLRAKYPGEFSSTAGEVLAWHQREAEANENASAWPAAVLHLDPLILAYPRRADLFARRGFALAFEGKWERAAEDYGRAVELGTFSERDAFRHALLRLWIGDLEGYRKACEVMAGRFGDLGNRAAATQIARACSLAPEAVSGVSRLVADLEQVGLKHPLDAESERYLAGIRFRAGRFEEAIERGGRNSPYHWLILALAHHRLGNSDESRAWLKKAEDWVERTYPGGPTAPTHPFWPEELVLRVLLREAKN